MPEKHPHVVRATVVVTTSDGEKVSWLFEGDEETHLEYSTKPEYEEWRTAASFLSEYRPTGYTDLGFTFRKVPGRYTMFTNSGTPPSGDLAPPEAIEAARPAVEDGRDGNATERAE